MQRATRAAEQLAKRAMDEQLQKLQEELVSRVDALKGFDLTPTLQEQLMATGNAIAASVRDALASTAPLLVPLCDLLSLRADGMAKHLVSRLYSALLCLAKATLGPTSQPAGVLVRAGLCLHMVSSGIAQVPAMLRAQLASHGLGGAALGFDAATMSREMQRSANVLLERFVEMQAQKLSLEVTQWMQATDWLNCPQPAQVTHLVQRTVAELSSMQSLALQILPGDPTRSFLPQGPFPSASATIQVLQQRSQQVASSSAIQKDLQRMFARKISFSTATFDGSASTNGKASVSPMLAHVTKLMLKTLVEEVRLNTFGRAGFQQIQVDCSMLRWMLPESVEDDGSVIALLDEAIISCQERCLDPVLVEHTAIEALCEAKRKEYAHAL